MSDEHPSEKIYCRLVENMAAQYSLADRIWWAGVGMAIGIQCCGLRISPRNRSALQCSQIIKVAKNILFLITELNGIFTYTKSIGICNSCQILRRLSVAVFPAMEK